MSASQKNGRRAEPDPQDAEIAVPERVVVSMAEIAGAASEGLLALGCRDPSGDDRHVR